MINNVVLVGRLTKDADLRYTANGSAVATFTLAVNRAFSTQNGEREADFVTCVIWRKSAEALANYTRKGSLIGVVGRIQTRNYDNQQGQRVYVTEVICDSFQMLESRQVNEQRKQDPSFQDTNYNNENYQSNQVTGQSVPPFGNSSQIDIADDDLPF